MSIEPASSWRSIRSATTTTTSRRPIGSGASGCRRPCPAGPRTSSPRSGRPSPPRTCCRASVTSTRARSRRPWPGGWLNGVPVRTDVTVQDVADDAPNALAVRTAAGPIAADAIVVAAGAWTPALVRSLGARVPIIGGKGYALDYLPAPVELRQSLYLHEDRVAMTPYAGRLRLSGTMELTGLDTSISRRRAAAIARAGSHALRTWPAGTTPSRVSAGLRPLTPDGLPVIGALRGHPRVFVASGHSMLGVTLGPATGDALASGSPVNRPTSWRRSTRSGSAEGRARTSRRPPACPGATADLHWSIGRSGVL